VPSSPGRLLAAVALAAFLAALAVAVLTGLGDDDSAAGPPRVPTTGTKTPARETPARPRPAPWVTLTAVGAFDPEGDGQERNDEAPLAVDGRASTFWRTEHYSSFFKSGVGLVLDMGRRARVERVLVDAPVPGSTAEIQLGDSPQGPFRAVTPARALTPRTSFSVPRRTGRYVVVWITGMPQDSAAEVSEVRVRART
jgi:putative peptidoglycan lipid II flippase